MNTWLKMEFMAWKGLFSIASMRPCQGNTLSILIYHRVLPARDELQPDYPSAEEFDQQMSWVANVFNVLPLTQAVKQLKEGSLPKRAIAITFDDGYEDNYSIALPILKRYQLPATFFVTLGFLHSIPKWDYLIEAVRGTNKKSVDYDGSSYSLCGAQEKLEFLNAFIPKIKILPESQADQRLWDMVDTLGRTEPNARLMMTAEQVIEMSHQDGIEIGAHGVQHHILTKVSDELAQQELKESIEGLSEMLGKPIVAQAFPNGFYPTFYSDKHIDHARNVGFDYATSTNPGINTKQTSVYKLYRYTPWRLSRHGFLSQLLMNSVK